MSVGKLVVCPTPIGNLEDVTLRVLRELEVRGVPTTRDLALEILASPEFRSGDYSTSFLDEVELEAVA